MIVNIVHTVNTRCYAHSVTQPNGLLLLKHTADGTV